MHNLAHLLEMMRCNEGRKDEGVYAIQFGQSYDVWRVEVHKKQGVEAFV